MGGGLLQLVAYGAQDIYLTGNPQITFFKVVYRRHTNFSVECIEQTLAGSIGTGESSITATISRNGDLVKGLHLDVLFNKGSMARTGGSYINWTNNTGHAYIKEATVEIGGQEIDKHYGSWISMWLSLTSNKDKANMLNSMGTQVVAAGTGTASNNLYLPLFRVI